MGRRYVYYCDNCKTEFGDKAHLHINAGRVSVAHLNEKDKWRDKDIGIRCNEYQFCNLDCFVKWVSPYILGATEDIKNG